jgi:hypothetical protein
MREPSQRLSAAGYTRESVDDYVRAAASERHRIERAMAAARARTDLAERRAEWLDELTPPSPESDDTAPFGTAAIEPSSPSGWDGTEPETSRALAGSPSLFAYE